MRISDWSSDVCSSDLPVQQRGRAIAAIGFPVRIVSHPHLAQIEQPHHCRDHRLLFRPAVSQIALHLPPQSGQRFAELKAAVVFPRFLGLAIGGVVAVLLASPRSEEHTSELQSLMRISYAVFCLKKKKQQAKTLLHHEYNSHFII